MRPPRLTEVSPSWDGSGFPSAFLGDVARFRPLIETQVPGASGAPLSPGEAS